MLHSRYLLVLGMSCVLIVGGVIALAASGFYYRHSSYFYDTIEEHQFNVRDQNADVVFIGDSSLLHGVLPEIIRRDTGLRAYNLGLPIPGFILAHQELIRRYLAHNKPPRLVVLYLASTLRTKPPYVLPPVWYEGETMLVRYGGSRSTFDFFYNNSAEVSRFLTLAGRRIVQFDWSGRRYRQLASALDSAGGYISRPEDKALDTDSCPLSKTPVTPDEDLLRQFRQDVARPDMAVAVYLAPMPDCDPTFTETSTRYASLVDNQPYTLPRHLFIDDATRQHLLAAGAEQNTPIVAAFLRRTVAALGTPGPGSADGRGAP